MPAPISIQVENLTKKFDDFIAVDHIQLKVEQGEILGFLGPNGAGKTTSIRMICGLLKPDEGSILFNGKTLLKAPGGKSMIGFCPQDNVHWERLTCTEQIIFVAQMYGMRRKLAKLRAAELVEQLGILSHADNLAKTLSGGMQRRLNIGLAIVHNPPVLIFDEPEAGLDPQSRVLMRDFIKSLVRDHTIILTTHNMDEADRLSTRVAIMDQGKILRLGTPFQLKEELIRKTDSAETVDSEKVKGVTLEDVFINLTGKKLRNA